MGLDMFLFKARKSNHSAKELSALDRHDLSPEDEDIKDLLPLYESDYSKGKYCIFKEVAYWRKFNALHQWFVTHVQIGIDNCDMYEVTKDHILDLLDTLFSVIEEKDPTYFMPTSGFFFGSTEVDEYYWEQIADTREKMYCLLNDFDWENERLFYLASW